MTSCRNERQASYPQTTTRPFGQSGRRLTRLTVILDMMLPGISGPEVAQILQESGILPGAPLIVATAVRNDEAKAAFLPYKPAAILIKPFDIDSLLDAVHKGLADALAES